MPLLQDLTSQQLIDSIGMITLALDSNACIDMINKAGCETLGLSREELTGKHWIDNFIFPDDQTAIQTLFTDILLGKKENRTYHTNDIIARHGERRTISWHNTLLTDPQDDITGILCTGEDITDKIELKEQYKDLFEQSPLCYFSSNLTGRIIAVNKAVIAAFGYPAEALVGKQLSDFMADDSCKQFFCHFPRLLAGETFSGTDYNIIRADGRIVTVQVTAGVINDDNGNPSSVHIVAVDVTRQRLAAKQIEASEKKYRSLFERAPVGILHFDTNLHITECNDHYLHLMEISRGEVTGFDVKNLKDKRVIAALQKALQGEEGWWEGEYHATFTRKKIAIAIQTAPLFDPQGHVIGGMVIVVDRSRQKRDKDEKNLLLSAIDQTSETIVITDTDGTIQYVNPAFEQVTGFTMEEALGKHHRMLTSGQHEQGYSNEMHQAMARGQVWRGSIINRCKDGRVVEEDVTISPVRNHEGVITNFIEVKRDITRETTLKKQLHQALKMEAIGTMAGGIAHDFNNILSAILGYAEMVIRQLPEKSQLRHDVDQIIIAGNRAADLVKQILSFSRQKEEDKKPVKLQFIVKEALKLFQSSLPSTIALRQKINANCGTVLADPVRIHQVLMNLCTNAKQALEQRPGQLTVSLREITVEPEKTTMHHLSIHPGRWLELQITDTGHGIEPHIQDKIFDPFFTTRKNSGGTGLGLSVVHGIIKSHDGEITVTSTPGQGTTFYIYLPVITEHANVTPASIKPAYLPSGNEHILLVDDEPLLVNILHRLLTNLGYSVQSFTDSREAIRWFADHGKTVDLVVTDMTMPHLSGEDLAKQILKSYPAMPIILCTGYSAKLSAEQARAIGIQKYVTKPVKNQHLAVLIRQVLDQGKK